MNTAAAPRILTFRPARTEDIGAIVALVQSSYRGESGKRGWTTESDMLDGQRTDPAGVGELLRKPRSIVLLAESGGALLACANVEKLDESTAYFGLFAVRPDTQNGGVGRAVMAEAERIAREDFICARMEMTVISIRDELIAWYERRGYRRTGQYSPFPYGDARFGIPRRDDLRFETLVKTL